MGAVIAYADALAYVEANILATLSVPPTVFGPPRCYCVVVIDSPYKPQAHAYQCPMRELLLSPTPEVHAAIWRRWGE